MTPEQLKDLFFNKPYSRLLVLVLLGGVVACTLLVTNRLRYDRSVARSVNTWRVKYAYIITNLSNDLKRTQTDALANNNEGLKNDCEHIKADAQNAQSRPAIPDHVIQDNWAVAMKDEVRAADECVAGLNANDQNKFKLASADFNSATSALSNVSKQLTAAKASAR